jgi:hypothetical protein
MARSLIKLNLFILTYEKLATFAQVIHDGFIAQVADYATPNPTMVDFQTDIDALNAAIFNWGLEGNRGSHADHVALLTAITIVKDDLRMLSAYAENTQPNNPDSWTDVGFTLKSAKTPPAPLQMVQNFHQFISRSLVAGTIKLKWKRPLEAAPSDVKCYVVQYNNSPVQPQIDGSRGVVNVIGIVTDTSLIVVPPFIGANYFWVTPLNTVGFGVSSEAVFYNAPGKILG